MIATTNYNILFQETALEELQNYLLEKDYSKIFVLVDENTAVFCLPILRSALSKLTLFPIQIKAGEPFKNIDTCQFIWKALAEGKADRKSMMLNLGGGVIGDMGGFCAATFKRGMDFIQIPTTLLSQVDASVGGKLGIDFFKIKNAIGLFQTPSQVCIYSSFLETLPKRELYSGFAEVIKHALIADQSYWLQLEAIQSLTIADIDWNTIIRHSVQLKHQVVEIDPLEKGLRKILNFGHTIGHAIESLSWDTDQPLLHGEAIAIGMICEAYLSVKALGLSEGELQKISAYLFLHYPSYNLSDLSTSALLELMHQDKKNEGGAISFSLLNSIGQASFNIHVSDDLILDSLVYYKQLSI